MSSDYRDGQDNAWAPYRLVVDPRAFVFSLPLFFGLSALPLVHPVPRSECLIFEIPYTFVPHGVRDWMAGQMGLA